MNPPHKKPPDETEPDEITQDDIQWIRAQRKADAHAEWLRGQIKVIYPWAISVIGALVAAIIWIREHVRL